jgi:uncharacterized protein (DUF2267 family)
MSATGLKVFDSTVQTTNIWLDDLMQEMDWGDRQRAYHALRAVLQALRDRLPVDEAAQFSAQLPMLVRGIFYEGWHPHGKPAKQRDKEAFLAHVAEGFSLDLEADPVEIVQAVFKVLSLHMTAGEIQGLQHCLPAEVRELWN